jgi:RNA ligase (TIGR02306 family)
MRKLASIQRVWDVQPIEGSDFLQQVKVEGWTVVANKGDFQKGDLAVYFEIDSFLPVRPEFEFLRKTSYKNTDIMGEGFRLRTIKLRGVLSQGLVLPISTFKELPADIELGTDVTEKLGVKKWEIEERATTGGTVIGTLPYDVPHTDETRVQS